MLSLEMMPNIMFFQFTNAAPVIKNFAFVTSFLFLRCHDPVTCYKTM